MTRGLAVELPESTNVIERHRWFTQRFVVGVHGSCAAKMERRPQQHRSMTVRKNETISIGPYRILGIEAQHPIPDRIDQRRQRHWCTWVSGLGLLNGVDRKSANSVDAQLI